MTDTTDTTGQEGGDTVTLKDIDFTSPRFNISIQTVTDYDNDVSYLAFVANWINDYSGVEATPEWMQLQLKDRVIGRVPEYQMSQALNSWGKVGFGPIDLPCPPYNFEVNDEAKLEISTTDGRFVKAGTKAEWESVLSAMRRAVEDMPDGIDISGMHTLDYEVTVTYTAVSSLDVTELLDGHDEFDGTHWLGTEDGLTEAIEDYFQGWEPDNYDVDYMDKDIASIDSVEISDLRGWVRDAVANG